MIFTHCKLATLTGLEPACICLEDRLTSFVPQCEYTKFVEPSTGFEPMKPDYKSGVLPLELQGHLFGAEGGTRTHTP